MTIRNVAIIGGAGHVGLPLGIFLANRGHRVTLLDRNQTALAKILGGRMPFFEKDAEAKLISALGNGNLSASADPTDVRGNDVVFCVVGTGLDHDNKPDTKALLSVLQEYKPYLSEKSLFILRSTVSVGTTRLISNVLSEQTGSDILVAYCPERIAEHKALEELQSLPQIISGSCSLAIERAREFFSDFTETLELELEEAEFAKLMCNTWRYSKFAIANEFYLAANSLDLDYEKIRKAAIYGYKRASDLPKAGLASGPCLPKDSLQLLDSAKTNLDVISAAHRVNTMLPESLVQMAKTRFGDLRGQNVLILGYTFKPNSDDLREALSPKIARILLDEGAFVSVHDPWLDNKISVGEGVKFVSKPNFPTYKVVFLAIPHSSFLEFETDLVKSDNVIRFD